MPLSIMNQYKLELWLCLCTVQTISICSTFHSGVHPEGILFFIHWTSSNKGHYFYSPNKLKKLQLYHWLIFFLEIMVCLDTPGNYGTEY